MLDKSRELIFAVIAIVFITFFYLLIQSVTREVPAASSFWGHSLGVLGFILMMMTEILYSMRKRSKKGARWGKMSNWLEFHVFTGLVGPYMVLIHPGWQFQGLAGVLSVLTVVMVLSGIFGRYIYTAIPRSTSGAEISLQELEYTSIQLEAELARLQHDEKTRPIIKSNSNSRKNSVLIRFWFDIRELFLVLSIRMGKKGQEKQKALALAQINREYKQVQQQISNLAAARQFLSIWHAIHIPLGLTLFIVAFIHIGAAIYYSVLLN